ncbi:MAG: hypothetical protein IKL35_07670 [Muribaculaceae bacterium]|nr:hypothetical protein [Muribaculaceae bacterium]
MKNDRKRILISALMLMLFLSYQAGFSLFTHTHTIDGIKIVHSHPYAGDNHAHTDAQIFAISHLSTFWGEEVSVSSGDYVVYEIINKIGSEVECVNFKKVNIENVNFRAPPFCC